MNRVIEYPYRYQDSLGQGLSKSEIDRRDDLAERLEQSTLSVEISINF
jgi:hypothetical protein